MKTGLTCIRGYEGIKNKVAEKEAERIKAANKKREEEEKEKIEKLKEERR